MPPLSRREFVLAAASGALPLLHACSGGSDSDDPATPLDAARFSHGVASGDPLPDAVILWTRAESDAGTAARIRYEVAREPGFSKLVRTGTVLAEPDADYAVKLDVTDLVADTAYYYRFVSASDTSPIGRTRTLPEPNADPQRLRLAFVTCSNYIAGYFHAYRRVAERNDLQAVVHLGDYIYENGAQDGVRPHDPPHEIVSLADYRTRYAQYRSDEDLQALHRQHPMIWVWDDHEVCNDAWKSGAQSHDPELGDYLERRLVAARAAFEWLPIRPPDPDDPLRVYRDFRFGALADLTMLDTRHIGRDEQLPPNTLFGEAVPVFTQTGDYVDPERQLLGGEQEAWFAMRLAQKTATWQLIGNQVYFSPLKLVGTPVSTGGGVFLSPDKWDGYQPARDRMLAMLEGRSNVVFLTGDAHEAYAFEVTPDPNGPAYSPLSGQGAVAVEFVATSISSRGDPDTGNGLTSVLERVVTNVEQLLRVTNPHLKYYQNTLNGYLLLDLTPDRLQAEFWMVPRVGTRTDEQALNRAFAVTNGVSHLDEASEATQPIADAPSPAP